MDTVITLSPQERNALVQLLESALRSSGLAALDVANHFIAKLNAADAKAIEDAKAAAETKTH